MRRLPLVIATAAIFAAPASSQPVPQKLEIHLASFAYNPDKITLRAGQPVLLHFVNDSRSGHNFSAPRLFASAAHVAGPVKDGTVELRGHETADVELTPVAGTYPVRCTHTLHSMLGMSGQVVVR